jgi:hypothetical protein
MQSWVQLFVQVAKPVLKTLAYAGTAHLLEQIQTEVKQQQQQNTLSFFQGMGIEQQKVRKLHRLLTYGASIIDPDSPNPELETKREEVLQSSSLKQQALNKSSLQLSLQLPENNHTLEHWPLRLCPRQLLDSSTSDGSGTLKILISYHVRIITYDKDSECKYE